MNLLHIFAEKDKHTQLHQLFDRYIDAQQSPLSVATPLCMVKIMNHLLDQNYLKLTMDEILKIIGLPEIFSHKFFTQLLHVEHDKYENLTVEIDNKFDLVDSLTSTHKLLRTKSKSSMYKAIRISKTRVKLDFENI